MAFNGIVTTVTAIFQAENFMNQHTENFITNDHADWLQARGVDMEVAQRMKIYSDLTSGNGSGSLVFPFIKDGQIVNRKYRCPETKRFWQDANAERCFWNHDVLDDPNLKRLVITEGELDAVIAIQNGFPWAVSVPDGAVPEGGQAETKLGFMADEERLWQIPEIVIATDNDGPGQTLAKELVRRLGAVRCFFLEWPDGCKDLNDIQVQYGGEEVIRVLRAAKPYPVKGLYKLSEYPDIPAPKTYDCGWDKLAKIFKPAKSTLTVITGVPSSGKSKFTTAFLLNLMTRHEHKAVVASFEMPVVPYLRNELRHQITELNSTKDQKVEADKWVEDHFVFIDQDPRDEEDEATLDWVLSRASDAVIRHGVDWVLIDPWNQIDDNRRSGESTPEYQKRAIKALKRFAKSFEVGVIVVAHPTKDVKKQDGTIREPNLYDIDGSAHWYNAADHGLVLDRALGSKYVNVMVKKARFKGTGEPGNQWMFWNESMGKYLETDDPNEKYKDDGTDFNEGKFCI